MHFSLDNRNDRKMACVAGAAERAVKWSPFLALVMGRETELAGQLRAGIWTPPRPEIELGQPVARALRLARRRMALTVAVGDLAGVMDLGAVTTALTGFADLALDTAIRAAIEERTPGVDPVGFAALALGKQGSGELNYSSDIDPILIYDPAILPCRSREDPAEAAVRIARRVLELLQARDADGYVLRVDLRLRPAPEVMPIAIPVDAAITHYESEALPWERAAFIRARACAGDRALGERFLAAIRPFIWRRSLDFGAVREITDISARIRDHYAQGQAFGPGYDLKRGRGGIREIEFFAQIHQLIHGGRDPALRAPATRDALAALAEAGLIARDTAGALDAAYVALRTAEHRVQMVDDRQTHLLPAGESLDRLAWLDGRVDGAALLAALAPHVERVGATYDTLAPATDTPASTAEAIVGRFAPPLDEEARQLVERWRSGRYPALRSAPARTAFEAVLPPLLETFAEAPEPRAALIGFDRLVERLPSALNIFRLLEARPALLALMATILAQAPTLAEDLSRRPDLLDGLIDASAFDPLPDVAALEREMRSIARDADYQAALEQVRRIVGERRFMLGAQIVSGAGDPLEVARGYARLAEAAVETLAAATVAEFSRAHGRVPDSEFVILALGRLGGGAMTHASDLDLVYLFTGAFGAESDGAKPLGATLYYNRLGARITSALSVPTAAGALYPIDTRLRPSGTQGPLVVSLDSFARYQREDAWTWERMALTRARPIFGSPQARAAVAAVIEEALHASTGRDVAADAREMRREMAAHKPPAGPLDAKLLPGGLVDLEFAVHVRQLIGATAFHPDLGAAIADLAGQGRLPDTMRAAYDFLTRLLVTVRLVAPDAQEPPPSTRALIARVLGEADWAGVLARLDSVRQEVTALEVGDAAG
jgi:glutamate-ammonia-ligase adenylyltransferase